MTPAYRPSGFHYVLEASAMSSAHAAAAAPASQFAYIFTNFFHPFVAELIEQLNQRSIDGIFDPHFQDRLVRSSFSALYSVIPDPRFTVRSDDERLDLSVGGAYANYNWELFFHVPLTIAVHLSKNQRFAEAQRWFHLIFDPTANDIDSEPPQRFWKFKPFRMKSPLPRIEEMLALLAKPEAECSDDEKQLRAEILAGYAQSIDHPFEPHRVAATRPLAYQLHVVMKYLDNLIAWGDSLFLEGTIESLNEATMRYVLANSILGPPPQQLPGSGNARPKTFAQLKASGLDAMGNALVQLEGHIPFNQPLPSTPPEGGSQTAALSGMGRSLYFCIPRNDRLLTYWSTVEDRLFKIRHCMDIHGTVRQLPQFEAPLDPGMLVKAAAGGIDVSSIVSGLNQPPGPVRAVPLIQKALEVCAGVRELGGALLSAIEKRDAEQLARLRAHHDVTLEGRSKELAFLRMKQSEEATESLLRSRQTMLERYKFYLHLLGREPDAQLLPATLTPDRRELNENNFDDAFDALVTQFDRALPLEAYPQLIQPGAGSPAAESGASGAGDLHLSTTESAEMDHSQRARDVRLSASIGEVVASVLTFIPEFDLKLAFWGMGGASKIFGGSKLSDAVRIGAEIQRTVATWESDQAGISGRTAGHERRVEEWTLQANLAARELMQVGRQTVSSLLAEQIARHEYLLAQTRIEQAGEVERLLLEGKQTGEELYAWMQSETSRLYYEYYRFAVDIARQAESTMKRELMRPEVDAATYIRFNYWNQGRHGLLAAEALHLDLLRMESAYHENNRREHELTRHVSLRQLDAQALLNLRVTGCCEISIPEWFYDRDCPGHYLRRLKHVSVSLPAVAGPYTSINCTLTLIRSQVRTSSQLGPNGEYERNADGDTRFIDYFAQAESIVTSGATSDGGLFEANLSDPRFLPFEGAGAVSTWRLELPDQFRGFDYASISDAILHIRYTARSAGEPLRTKTAESVKKALVTTDQATGALLFSMRHDFATEWSAFARGDALAISLRREHFPYIVQDKSLKDRSLKVHELRIYVPAGGDLPSPSTPAVPAGVDEGLNGTARLANLTFQPDNVLKRDAPDAYLVVRYSVTD